MHINTPTVISKSKGLGVRSTPLPGCSHFNYSAPWHTIHWPDIMTNVSGPSYRISFARQECPDGAKSLRVVGARACVSAGRLTRVSAPRAGGTLIYLRGWAGCGKRARTLQLIKGVVEWPSSGELTFSQNVQSLSFSIRLQHDADPADPAARLRQQSSSAERGAA